MDDHSEKRGDGGMHPPTSVSNAESRDCSFGFASVIIGKWTERIILPFECYHEVLRIKYRKLPENYLASPKEGLKRDVNYVLSIPKKKQ